MKKITLLLTGGVLAIAMSSLATAFCPFPESSVEVESAPAAIIEVSIENFSFGSGTVNIPVGATVKWTNRDDIPHTVVSAEGLFKSDALDTGDSFSYRFDKAGAFDYFCSLHPKMTGKIVAR